MSDHADIAREVNRRWDEIIEKALPEEQSTGHLTREHLRAVAKEAQRGMAEDLLVSLDWVSLRDGPEHGLQVVRRKIRERAGGDE